MPNNPVISCDGAYLAFVTEASEIRITYRDDITATNSRVLLTASNIVELGWTQNSDILWFSQGTPEDCKIYSLNILSHVQTCLTPTTCTSKIVGTSKVHPNHVVLISNARSTGTLDLYLSNILTGKLDLILENDGAFTTFLPDPSFSMCALQRVNPQTQRTEIFTTPLPSIHQVAERIVTKQITTTTVRTTKDLGNGVQEVSSKKVVATTYTSSSAKASVNSELVASISPKDKLFGGFSGYLELVGFDGTSESLFINYVSQQRTCVRCDLNSIERTVLDRVQLADPSTNEVLNASETSVSVLSALGDQDGKFTIADSSSSGFSLVVRVERAGKNEFYLYNRAVQSAELLFTTAKEGETAAPTTSNV